MTLLSEKQCLLDGAAARARRLHPKVFDEKLSKGVFQLFANADSQFFESRSLEHLRKFLVVQFFLQKRIENALAVSEHGGREVIIHIFSASSRICLALVFSFQRESEFFNTEHIQKSIQAFTPEVKEIPDSFISWQSIKHSYLFCYVELETVNGKSLSRNELKKLQANLQKHIIHGVVSWCPSVFSPYNYEESYRQLLLIYKEVQNSQDLPQLSIHFRGQTPSDLEFLVYMVRPESKEPLETKIGQLPSFIRFVSHIHSTFNGLFPSEASAFSLHIPISCLDSSPTLNLLRVRKYVAKLLEKILGPFRDFNGGLLTQQEEIFAKFKNAFEHKISDFHLFAETLFYSLKPIEAQITLQVSQAETLFKAFSSMLGKKSSFFFQHDPKGVLILQTRNVLFIEPMIQKIKKLKNVAYASMQLADMHYLVFLDPFVVHASELEMKLSMQSIRFIQRSSTWKADLNKFV